jgi:nitroreductase
MPSNPIVEAMLSRKSIRKYRPDAPSDETVGTVVRAGQQAPFAYQMGSLLLSRQIERNPFHAPLLFTICIDSHRLELILAHRGWTMVECDLSVLLLGIQDAALMAENMVIAAESLGMGSCFLGDAPYRAAAIAAEYELPARVFPLVQLAMGYPAEDIPPRPRYPLEFVLSEDKYREPDEELVQRAMAAMDEGYLAQGYYRTRGLMINLEGDREETYTYDTYGWTEHMSRKAGQWFPSPAELIAQLEARGFHITRDGGSQGDA